MFNIVLYWENMKIFLSETTKHRALIFGMKYHLVDPLPSLFKLCSASWSHVLHKLLFYGPCHKIVNFGADLCFIVCLVFYVDFVFNYISFLDLSIY